MLTSGCATDVVSRSEHAELMSSVRALRAENSRLESRVTKLESQLVVTQSRAAVTPKSPPTNAASAVDNSDAMPPLAVVKLKPRREAAPKISTNVEVAEPPETLTDLQPTADANDPSVPDTEFERGMTLLKTGSAAEGLQVMQQFTVDWPRHPKADNALYFAGLAAMADRDFGKASELFERVLAQYPAGDAVLDAMLKLADCRVRLNRPREARATWEKIVTNFPGTTAASQAQARLAAPHQTPVASP